MTSAYTRTYVQTLGEGEGSQESALPGRIMAEVKFCISSTPLVSAVNHMAALTFRVKIKTATKDSFFSLHFNVDINLDNGERARARNKWQRRQILLEEKHEKEKNSGGKKVWNASGYQVKMSRSEKTKWPVWSLRSLKFCFFSAIVAIVAIIWKPGLSLYIRLYAAALKAELA